MLSGYKEREIIIACSTSLATNSAIGIIRISSGIEDIGIFRSCLKINTDSIKPRFAHYTSIHSPLDGSKLDDIVLTYFKAPHTYNGENILELSVHGGLLNIDRIIQMFIDHYPVRYAKAGEFSYRALINNKMNLGQIEGLDLLLNATSPYALEQGMSLLSGKLQADLLDLHNSFVDHRSAVEFFFDFLEDIGEEKAQELFNKSLFDLSERITHLKVRSEIDGEKLLRAEVALLGLPNAGKSTLFNILLNEERAIVSNIAGTTRDYIGEQLRIDNNIFQIYDTAGVRTSSDEIEEVGIQKGLQIAKSAFFKVLVISLKDKFNLEKIKVDLGLDLIIFSHLDEFDSDLFTSIIEELNLNNLVSDRQKAVLKGLKESGSIEPKSSGPIEPKSSGPIEPESSGPIEPESSGPIEPESSGPIEPESSGPIEPKTSGPIEPALLLADFSDINGRPLLIKKIQQLILNKYQKLQSEDPLIVARHRSLVQEIYKKLLDYQELTEKEEDIAILASELNNMGHCISELIGIVSPNEVLDNIFSNFCIGK